MEDITIVVPLFNETGRWQADYWQRMMEIPGTRWLFVDDGSTDGTREVLSIFAGSMGAGVLSLDSNVGKANAVRAGLHKALQSDTPGLGFLDGDGAFEPEDVARIVSEFRTRCLTTGNHGADDSVWASRVALAGHNIDRRASRHYVGRVIATLISPGLPSVPYDTQCGFKVFRASEQLADCLKDPFETRWFFDVELLQRWLLLTGQPMRVWEVPLLNWRDVAGSKLSGSSSLQVIREVGRVMRTNRRLS